MPRLCPRYLTGASFLLALACALFAAAAAQLDAAGATGHGTPPHAPPGAAAPAEVPTAPDRHDADSVPAPGPPAAGEHLTLARARLAGSSAGPRREVDRWAVHLASERDGSEAALTRYSAYRPLIHETLRRYGLPLDLAFVPWVESEWKNTAESHAGAEGMWQFMAATARGYGLEVSEYVDERRDPVRSTDAAARHLLDLFRETGDWHTALAAYNAGIGRVGNRGSFWRRRASLPADTRVYVPRVLAAARVGRAPVAWGLNPPAAPPLRFREVWVPGGVPLDSAALRIGVPAAAVRELNPHLIRHMTPPGRRWPVRVPVTAPATTFAIAQRP